MMKLLGLVTGSLGGVYGYLAIAVLSAAIAAGGAYKVTAWAKDEKINQLKLADAAAEKADLIRNANIMQSAVTTGFKIASDELAREQKTVTLTNTIIREVPKYVSTDTDKRFPVPWGLVRLHDAAALGLGPADIAADQPVADGTASDVEASALSSVIAENYGACRQAFDRVKALEEDDEAVRALFPVKTKPTR